MAYCRCEQRWYSNRKTNEIWETGREQKKVRANETKRIWVVLMMMMMMMVGMCFVNYMVAATGKHTHTHIQHVQITLYSKLLRSNQYSENESHCAMAKSIAFIWINEINYRIENMWTCFVHAYVMGLFTTPAPSLFFGTSKWWTDLKRQFNIFQYSIYLIIFH